MPGRIFDDLTDVYESMIDWPKRLAHEEPFYRKLVDGCSARRVLDAACGTGRHAALLHSWGLEVEGADLSRAMLDRARANFGQPPGLHWVQRGFDQPVDTDPPFDLVLCVGNSLPLAPDRATIGRAIRELLLALRPDGRLVVQILNLWRLPDGPCQWQKCQRATLPQGAVVIIKGVHRSGDQGFVDLLVIDPAQSPPALQSDTGTLVALGREELEQMARQAGARQVNFYGGYHDEPYAAATSIDLVMVAIK